MFKNVSIQWRITILSSILIAICCISLSFILNVSANRMADSIEAIKMPPAFSIEEIEQLPEITEAADVTESTQEIAIEARASYFQESMMYTSIAVLLGGILTYYLSGKMLKPIKELSEETKKISAYNLDELIEVPQTNDEITVLTESFNDLIIKLEKSFSAQKRFSASAAHELRTPLAILQTKLDVFNKRTDHTQQEYTLLLDSFQKQISRLKDLVNELLEIANLDQVKDKERINLNDIFESILNDLEFPIIQKNITVNLDLKPLYVVANYDLIYRMFYNIIENSIKYNEDNGMIMIQYNQNERNTTIKIMDTGMGISENDKSLIFEPFYRENKNDNIVGLGLGLSLVKTIVEKHHGQIAYEVNKPKGSIFIIVLPNK